MTMTAVQSIPVLQQLPSTLPLENAVRLELEEGVPIFRATSNVQTRIEDLLEQQKIRALTSAESREMDLYEEIDDYLSFVNRTVRNLLHAESAQKS